MSRSSTRKHSPRASPASPAPTQPAATDRLGAVRPLIPLLAIVLALLPVLNIVHIINSTGADNPSVDYYYYMGMIDRILSGSYDWSRYFYDTFTGGAHSMAIPVALRLAVIKLTAWNLRVEHYLVVLFSLLRLLVLHRLLTPALPPLARWCALPLLSALVFSVSQTDTFTYGDAGLQYSLIHLGFVLGLWALVRAEGRTSGVAWMAAAGLLSTLSGGGGLVVWPVFLLGMLLLGYRRRGHFSLWAAGALLGFLPYLAYLFVTPKQAGRRVPAGINLRWFVNALGWPLADNIGIDRAANVMAFGAGLAAVLLLTSGFALLVTMGRKRGFREAMPALLLVLMGLISTGLIGMFRASIGPWYATAFMVVWIGLLGLVPPVWLMWRERSADLSVAASSMHRLTPLWIGGVPLILVALYLNSNISFEDKTMLLYYRSFASASAIRNFRTAPTHCPEFLIVGMPRFTMMREFGEPLEKHRLSLFAPQQTWALQGDFLLHTVTVTENPGTLPVRWCEGPGGPVFPWSDYRRLDLRLHGSNQVSWRVVIPAGAKTADFRSDVAMGPYESASSAGWKLSLAGPSGEESLASGEVTGAFGAWKPLSLPLAKYAGQEITLTLAATGDSGSAPVLLRYPRLELDLPQAPPVPVPDELRPANTDRSPFFPKNTPRDLLLAVDRPEFWQLDAPLMAVPDGLRLYPGQSAQFRPRLGVDLQEYSHLKLNVLAGEDLNPPALRVFFGIQRPDTNPDFPFITLTLLPDQKPGGYSFDLRLLEIEPGTLLNTVRFFSVSDVGPMRITGCRLVRKTP